MTVRKERVMTTDRRQQQQVRDYLRAAYKATGGQHYLGSRSDLAEAAGLTVSALRRSIAQLERHDFVWSQGSANFVIVMLTAKGLNGRFRP